MDLSLTITVGPINGKVTESTARILVEFNKAGIITCILTSSKGDISKCLR